MPADQLFDKSRISPTSAAGAAFFWLVQAFIGLPALFQIGNLLLTGKVDGVLNVIALLLSWIGATLAVGVASLVHGSYTSVQQRAATNLSEPLPEGYEGRHEGVPYKISRKNGEVTALNEHGTSVTYRSWRDFSKAVGTG